MLKIRKITVEPTDVYDITVPDTECFFANDILVHNCQEILLPTRPFQRLDEEGEYKLTMDTGEEVTLAGEHKVLLKDGTRKKVRELNDNDDIDNLLI
jgi:intein/homing endonuclease